MERLNDSLLATLCVFVIFLPEATGQNNLDGGSIAGIAAGAVLAFVLVLAIIVICSMIVMRNSPEGEKGGRPPPRPRNRYMQPIQNDFGLAPAPNTISYRQPTTGRNFRAPITLPAIMETTQPVLGSSILGVTESAWPNGYQIPPRHQIPQIQEIPNHGNVGEMINSAQALQIQEISVPLDMGYNTTGYDTYM